MFRQRIDDGWQVELPETWLSHGNPWEFERRESAYFVGFGGVSRRDRDGRGPLKPAEAIEAIAVDTPVVGWRGKRVNTLRLWTAQAIDPIRSIASTQRLYRRALPTDGWPETLVRVLYPSDSSPAGRSCGCGGLFLLLRLIQTSCGGISSISRISALSARQGGDPAERHPSPVSSPS